MQWKIALLDSPEETGACLARKKNICRLFITYIHSQKCTQVSSTFKNTSKLNEVYKVKLNRTERFS